MKRLFSITLLMLGVLVSCTDKPNKPDEPDKPKEVVKIDQNAILLVNPMPTKSDEPYTAEYIVTNVAFFRRHSIAENYRGGTNLGLDLDDYFSFRDLVNFKLKFSGCDVVNKDGSLGFFFNWEDIVFSVAVYKGKRILPYEVTMSFDEVSEDTIAYIPNSVVRKCKIDVFAALEAGDIEECYRIFNEDFVFKAIESGAEWRKLKAEGIE